MPCVCHLFLILLGVFVFEANRAETVAALRWLADLKTAGLLAWLEVSVLYSVAVFGVDCAISIWHSDKTAN